MARRVREPVQEHERPTRRGKHEPLIVRSISSPAEHAAAPLVRMLDVLETPRRPQLLGHSTACSRRFASSRPTCAGATTTSNKGANETRAARGGTGVPPAFSRASACSGRKRAGWIGYARFRAVTRNGLCRFVPVPAAICCAGVVSGVVSECRSPARQLEAAPAALFLREHRGQRIRARLHAPDTQRPPAAPP